MSFASRLMATFAALVALQIPAMASTVPAVDLMTGKGVFAIGLPDVSVDVPLGDRLSLGASGIYAGLVQSVSARATWRLYGAPGQGGFGVTFAGGYTGYPIDTRSYWLQPALVLALPIGTTGTTFRATLGPLYRDYTYKATSGYGHAEPEVWPLWPNAELAFPLGEGQEWTLGGNSLIGYRAVL